MFYSEVKLFLTIKVLVIIKAYIRDEDATIARNTDDINIQKMGDVSDVVLKNTDGLRGLH